MTSAREFSSPAAIRGVRAGAEELVDDVERGDDGDAQRVRAGELLRGQPHLLVEVVGELADVLRLEVAPHGVTLAVDVDVNDAAFHGRAVRG